MVMSTELQQELSGAIRVACDLQSDSREQKQQLLTKFPEFEHNLNERQQEDILQEIINVVWTEQTWLPKGICGLSQESVNSLCGAYRIMASNQTLKYTKQLHDAFCTHPEFVNESQEHVHTQLRAFVKAHLRTALCNNQFGSVKSAFRPKMRKSDVPVTASSSTATATAQATRQPTNRTSLQPVFIDLEEEEGEQSLQVKQEKQEVPDTDRVPTPSPTTTTTDTTTTDTTTTDTTTTDSTTKDTTRKRRHEPEDLPAHIHTQQNTSSGAAVDEDADTAAVSDAESVARPASAHVRPEQMDYDNDSARTTQALVANNTLIRMPTPRAAKSNHKLVTNTDTAVSARSQRILSQLKAATASKADGGGVHLLLFEDGIITRLMWPRLAEQKLCDPDRLQSAQVRRPQAPPKSFSRYIYQPVKHFHTIYLSDFGCTTSMCSYDVDTNKWEKQATPDFIGERSDHQVVLVGDVIYVLFGQDPNSDQVLSSCIYLDLNVARVARKWMRMKCNFVRSSGIARVDAATVVVGHFIYMFGGCGVKGDEDYLQSFARLDTITNEWRVDKMQTPAAMYGAGAAVLGSLIYIVGGFNTDDEPLNTLYVYDVLTDKWNQLACMNYQRGNPRVTAGGNCLIVFGGIEKFENRQMDAEKELLSAEIYDPETNTWTILPKKLWLSHCGLCGLVAVRWPYRTGIFGN